MYEHSYPLIHMYLHTISIIFFKSLEYPVTTCCKLPKCNCKTHLYGHLGLFPADDSFGFIISSLCSCTVWLNDFCSIYWGLLIIFKWTQKVTKFLCGHILLYKTLKILSWSQLRTINEQPWTIGEPYLLIILFLLFSVPYVSPIYMQLGMHLI